MWAGTLQISLRLTSLAAQKSSYLWVSPLPVELQLPASLAGLAVGLDSCFVVLMPQTRKDNNTYGGSEKRYNLQVWPRPQVKRTPHR